MSCIYDTSLLADGLTEPAIDTIVSPIVRQDFIALESRCAGTDRQGSSHGRSTGRIVRPPWRVAVGSAQGRSGSVRVMGAQMGRYADGDLKLVARFRRASVAFPRIEWKGQIGDGGENL